MSTVVVFDVLYEQLLEEKKQTKLYRFERAYYSVITHSELDEVRQYSFERAYCTDTTWSHIVSLRGSVLCSHYISALQSKNSIKKDK